MLTRVGWLAQSSDLNSIENVWNYIKQQLRDNKITTIEDFLDETKREVECLFTEFLLQINLR